MVNRATDFTFGNTIARFREFKIAYLYGQNRAVRRVVELA